MRRIYLDYAASAPLLPEAAQAVQMTLARFQANPSSVHEEGRALQAILDEARERIAAAVGCLFAEVVFTSSGSEAANLAVVGTALAHLEGPRRRVLTSAIEHHCVLNARPILEALGYAVEEIPVSRQGVVDLDWLAAHLGDDVLLVNAMHANNELGTIQPIAEIGSLCSRWGALLHVDAVQTLGKLAIPTADLTSLSAHKVGGPQGVGALIARAGTRLKPVLTGGEQERGLRGGTPSAALIAGFGVAAADCDEPQSFEGREAFVKGLLAADLGEPTVPHDGVLGSHAHWRFPGVSNESLLIRLDRMGVSASAGAACSAGSLEVSHVLRAIGLSDEEGKECVRFSFGPRTTVKDAIEGAVRVIEAVRAIRDRR